MNISNISSNKVILMTSNSSLTIIKYFFHHLNTCFILSINHMLRNILLFIKIHITKWLFNFFSFFSKYSKIFRSYNSFIIPISKYIIISSFTCFLSINLVNIIFYHEISKFSQTCSFKELRYKNKFCILNLTWKMSTKTFIIIMVIVEVLHYLYKSL